MEVHKLKQIYENIHRMFTYRNIRLTSEQLDGNKFMDKLNHQGYVFVTGSRGADIRGAAECTAILINVESKYGSRSADFKKLLSKISNHSGVHELIFVADTTFSLHIKNALNEYRSTHPNVQIEEHNYDIFIIEIPKHSYVPKHEIATAEELEGVLNYYYVAKENFPKIMSSDPAAVWIGAKQGMVVKIHRLSENACVSIAWRLVVKG